MPKKWEGPKKNEIVPLEISGITNEGSGVGRHEGLAVFVPDTAAGDIVEARIVKNCGRYAYGRIERIVSPSPDRIEPNCPVGRRCGGCSLRHLSYEAECREKARQVRDAFERLGGFQGVPMRELLTTGQVDGYRNKAMFPVRSAGGQARIGFYAPRSHDVVDTQACRLHPPEFADVCRAVRGWIEECGVPCYDEADGSGFLRHLYLRKAFSTGQLMVCLVQTRRKVPYADVLLTRLGALKTPPASVAVNVNDRDTNVILGDTTSILSGAAAIEDVLCGVRVRLQPRSFYQVNHDAAELLYCRAAEYAALTGGETLIDLYCGAGTIGLSMAGRAGRLIGVEVVPQAVEDARTNARLNGVSNASFLCADAGQAAKRLEEEGVRPDVVVIDPPRKGCDIPVLEAIARMAPRRVVMISCNPATAARDCRILSDAGYVPREMTPVDLFPRTTHVELVCLLSAPGESD